MEIQVSSNLSIDSRLSQITHHLLHYSRSLNHLSTRSCESPNAAYVIDHVPCHVTVDRLSGPRFEGTSHARSLPRRAPMRSLCTMFQDWCVARARRTNVPEWIGIPYRLRFAKAPLTVTRRRLSLRVLETRHGLAFHR